MTDNHPIIPSPELVQQWRDSPEYTDGKRKLVMVTLSTGKLQDIATKASQWGADQELEACCEWAAEQDRDFDLELRAARRPKPLSLVEEALCELNLTANFNGAELSRTQVELIRAALERLQKLEALPE